MKKETICVQAGYQSGNGEPRVLPIYQSTTYSYESSEELAKLFDLSKDGHMYSRISNPTVECVEKKVSALEGGVGAMMTSSGQAASLISILNITNSGENFLCFSNLYGGTTNLFAVTLKKMGIEARFINYEMSDEEIEALIDEKTTLLFGETISNPSLEVLDIERYAALAHRNGIPLIVDNTFATPLLCRPFEFGADIVVHSTSKYMDGHAEVVGGMIVDSGRFDWSSYACLTEPDESYHGVIYTKQFGPAAYITKARTQLMRDLGSTPSPFSAFLLNNGLETLHLRIQRHSENALAVAKHLKNHKKVAWVSYPGLPDDKYHSLALKYLDNGMASGVVSFGTVNGKRGATIFMDSLKLAKICVHVADLRTCVLHPASTTHRQLTDEQLESAGVKPEFIRFSTGIENIEDIIADIDQALEKV